MNLSRIFSTFSPPIIMTEIFEIATFSLVADKEHYSVPMDQIMAEGGLFNGIEWPIFEQKGTADMAPVTDLLRFFSTQNFK
jgi:hypothetical protein